VTREERERRERANIEDVATFLVSRTRLAGVDEWEADRLAQVNAEASRQRDEHRAAAAAAVAQIRARGESISAIAQLAETTVSDVRAYLKLAAERDAQNASAPSSVVMCAEDKPVVAAEPPLADGGVIGSFTRVDPDDAAPALHPRRRGGCTRRSVWWPRIWTRNTVEPMRTSGTQRDRLDG
jgi:hypothetical protein